MQGIIDNLVSGLSANAAEPPNLVLNSSNLPPVPTDLPPLAALQPAQIQQVWKRGYGATYCGDYDLGCPLLRLSLTSSAGPWYLRLVKHCPNTA